MLGGCSEIWQVRGKLQISYIIMSTLSFRRLSLCTAWDQLTCPIAGLDFFCLVFSLCEFNQLYSTI